MTAFGTSLRLEQLPGFNLSASLPFEDATLKNT